MWNDDYFSFEPVRDNPLLGAMQEMFNRLEAELVQRRECVLEDVPASDFDTSIELCRTCYHTMQGCKCEVGGNV